jgi:septal ring factor EnvC (AmiA/AmiB activator)
MNRNYKIIIAIIFAIILLGGVYALGEYRGKSNSQLLSEQQLESLQQSVLDQSSKIDNLQKESTDSKKKTSTIDAQAIIQSSVEKTNREDQAKCQQELNEYNTCLSEYNSKMAEYNSCLTESSNPDSWRYKSYCSKPSNYCFKPVCAY